MFICPECKTEQQRRKNGSCPHCLTRVEIFTASDGTKLWVRQGEDTPNKQLLEFWFGRLSERLSQEQGRRVTFRLHPYKQKAKYRRELARAEDFLMQADWDLPLAKKALGEVVDSWFRPLITLSWAVNEYPVQLAIAMSSANESSSEEYTQKRLDAVEDVW